MADENEQSINTPYWQENGWQQLTPNPDIEVYKGTYKVKVDEENTTEYKGIVTVEKRSVYSHEGTPTGVRRRANVYLEDPPEEIRRHPHGSCLQLIPSTSEEKINLFVLHFNRPPTDPDTAILYMETMLYESFHPEAIQESSSNEDSNRF